MPNHFFIELYFQLLQYGVFLQFFLRYFMGKAQNNRNENNRCTFKAGRLDSTRFL